MFQTFRIRHRPESHLELRVGVHTGAGGDDDEIGGGLMSILALVTWYPMVVRTIVIVDVGVVVFANVDEVCDINCAGVN